MVSLRHLHVVDFYEEATELASRVASYLSEALWRGEAAVLIATSAHRRLYAEALGAMGVDVEACRAEGSLVEADAEVTLESFLVDGRIDRRRFDETVGGLLASTGSFPGMRVVGEMVHLLWARGDILLAIELETEWKRLVEKSGFPLYCCYGTNGLDEDADALAKVRDLHQEVVSAPPALDWTACRSSASFPPEPVSPAAARGYVAGVLAEWGLEELVETAKLVVSELATNALVHAGTTFEVTLSLRPGKLRVTVADSSAVSPVQREAALHETNGRGLSLVDAFAEAWGTDCDETGKAVWAEVGLEAAASPTSLFERRSA